MKHQDIRYYGDLDRIVPLCAVFYVSILSMIACSLLAGFYSKYLCMEFLHISENRIFLILIILISLSLSVILSLCLVYYLVFIKNISFMMYQLGHTAKDSS